MIKTNCASDEKALGRNWKTINKVLHLLEKGLALSSVNSVIDVPHMQFNWHPWIPYCTSTTKVTDLFWSMKL